MVMEVRIVPKSDAKMDRAQGEMAWVMQHLVQAGISFNYHASRQTPSIHLHPDDPDPVLRVFNDEALRTRVNELPSVNFRGMGSDLLNKETQTQKNNAQAARIAQIQANNTP